MAELIEVELVYALAEQQVLLKLQVARGTTARQVVLDSGLDQRFANLDLTQAPVGIFGKLLTHPDERILRAGERVEIYRPLLLDPKDIRKQRAAKAQQRQEQ